MRASVRIVMAALAALLAAVVWLGRDRQETLDSKANASESIVHTKSAPASNANRTQTAQFASHADSEHETRVTPSPEEAGDIEFRAGARCTAAAPHKCGYSDSTQRTHAAKRKR